MKMLKRSLAWMLALIMMISAVPFTAFASESTDVPSEATEAVVDAPAGETTPSEAAEAETVPETTVAEETVPETTVAEETVPETTVAEETVPETTVAEETVPETTVAEETVPETTVAEETVPEETVADEPVGEVPAVMSLTKAASVDASSFLKVFHLDCGRKYFSVDQIKELLDALSTAGYSHMELAIGNDGLRLLLDDMSVTANGTTYDSDTVKSGIKSGNEAYSHSGEWTQAEMDTIIAYAATKGIEIIPLVNTPGHMDSILAAMSECGISGAYNGSKRTVDITNTTAVAFTKALVGKYMDYFADKGCKYFNIGADEYANDVYTSGSMGWGHLISADLYDEFIVYVNALVEMVENKGMTPIAFNDGIYFNENTSFGTFDTRLVIAAWSGGWNGFDVAGIDFLQEKGHQILNTNERWYYVPGAPSGYTYDYSLGNVKSVDVTTVTDNTGAVPMGAMLCVWYDYPEQDYESHKSNILNLINLLAENNPTYFTGPNETVDPTPETVTKTDEATKVAVTAPGLTELTVTAVEEAELPVIEAAVAGQVVAWDMTPAAAVGAYVGEAVVSVPVSADWTNVRGGVLASDNGEEVMGIKGTLENGVFTFTVPHFSTVVAYASDYDELIELTIGETYDVVIEGEDLRNNPYTPDPEGVANVTVSYENVAGGTVVTLGEQIAPQNNNTGWSDTGVIKSGDYYLVMDSNGKLSATTDVSEATVFTVERSSNSRWTIKSGNYHLRYSDSSLSGSTDGNEYEWRYNDGFYRTSGGGSSSSSYLTYSNNNWTTSQSTNNKAALYDVTTTTTEPVDQSTVTFTGVAAGETYVTVENITYKIVVSKKAVSATVTVGETQTYTDTSVNAPVVANTDIATAVIDNGTLTISAKAAGTTTVTTDSTVYTITVVEFDPSDVDSLVIEYWITNLQTRTRESTSTNPVTSQQISAAAAGVATAEGADLDALLPDWTIKKDGDSGDDRAVEFWHVRMLDTTVENDSTSGTEEQTTDSADDETTNGDAVTRVRYYDPGDGNGHRWQLLSGTNWLDVNLTNNQIVAYYMEVVDITNDTTNNTEVHVNAADWGKLGDNSPASSYADTSKYCSISLQIVYEDGITTNPATTTAEDLDSKTILFNYWDNGRGIGTFAFDTMGQFNIYQITAETGEVSATFTGGEWGTAQVDSFTWDNNELVVWSGNSETASIYNNTSKPSSEGVLQNLMWDENHEAILIRIYVKAIETPNSLTVHYMDRSANDLEFYNYYITTLENEVFKEGFDMTGNGLELVNHDVTNYFTGEPQYVSADLKTMPEIKAYYRYCNYTLVDVERSADGKDVYLYYTFTPVVAFVADFGLPIEITPSDLNQDGYSTDISDITSVQVIGSKDTVAGSTAHSEYGTLSVSGTTVTYTPTQVLQNVDFFSIYVETTADDPNTDDDESAGINYRVYIFPATTVYYEESFMTYTGTWSSSAKPTMTQTTEAFNAYTENDDGTITITEVNKKNPYGYDAAYAYDAAASNNTMVSTDINGDTASFTFTGTGFELYANCDTGTGYVTVTSEGETKKMYMVDTGLNYGELNVEMPGTTETPSGNFYNIPIISEKDLPHGTYTVNIRKTNRDGQEFKVDGFRVINTIEDSTIYAGDLEDKPDFHQLRDQVLQSIGIAGATYDQVYANLTDTEAAIITQEGLAYAESATAQNLLNHGPKNEIYLFKDQTLTFNVETSRAMQIGLKAPNGVTTYDLTCTGVTSKTNVAMKTSVDMFYELGNATGTTKTFTVSVKNTGDNILAVTDLKICDDPNAAFVALTEDDIAMIMGAGADDEVVEPETTVPETTKPADKPTKPSKPQETTKPQTPTEPEVPSKPETPSVPQTPGKPQTPSVPEADKADAVLTVSLVDYAGRKLGSAVLSANGPEGATKVFTAAEILATAKAMLPQQYAFVDEARIADAAVAYGEEHTVSIQVGKVATLKINYISLFGRKLGSATITKVQTAGGRCLISASEIRAQAPNGRFALWLLPVSVNYGATASVAAVLF